MVRMNLIFDQIDTFLYLYTGPSFVAMVCAVFETASGFEVHVSSETTASTYLTLDVIPSFGYFS